MSNIIQGLWVGSELSVMERLSIRSFIEHGHEYHLYVYDEVRNVPPGAVLRDGNEILPRDRIFTISNGNFGIGSYAGFSDFFRYKLLGERGGWWVDTDVVCLKPFDFTQPHVIASSFEAGYGDVPNNCVLKMEKGSPLAAYCFEACDARRPEDVGYGETGPLLMIEAIKKLGFENFIAPHGAFCPIGWRYAQQMAYPENFSVRRAVRKILRPHSRPGQITRKSYAVHLWNEIWRRHGIDKNGSYPPASLYESLKRRYLAGRPATAAPAVA